MILLPGDVLLYSPSSLFGAAITLKTWHRISHVECYVGNGESVASRDGKGTGVYPVRWDHLVTVCRPPAYFNVIKALTWFSAQPHQPYGWWELLDFYGLNVKAEGIVCSPFVTTFLRAGDFDPFNGEPADKVAPFEFELVDEMRILPNDTPPEVAA